MSKPMLTMSPLPAGSWRCCWRRPWIAWVERFDAWVEWPFYHLLNRLWKRS